MFERGLKKVAFGFLRDDLQGRVGAGRSQVQGFMKVAVFSGDAALVASAVALMFGMIGRLVGFERVQTFCVGMGRDSRLINVLGEVVDTAAQDALEGPGDMWKLIACAAGGQFEATTVVPEKLGCRVVRFVGDAPLVRMAVATMLSEGYFGDSYTQAVVRDLMTFQGERARLVLHFPTVGGAAVPLQQLETVMN
ncbi:hypothetical protein T484DRAFT_1922156 [Baffinella frigidus]|nr:hypothetical protein T484DRAFT_1922156 [Cryptophyta sp. CCMP2293]